MDPLRQLESFRELQEAGAFADGSSGTHSTHNTARNRTLKIALGADLGEAFDQTLTRVIRERQATAPESGVARKTPVDISTAELAKEIRQSTAAAVSRHIERLLDLAPESTRTELRRWIEAAQEQA